MVTDHCVRLGAKRFKEFQVMKHAQHSNVVDHTAINSCYAWTGYKHRLELVKAEAEG